MKLVVDYYDTVQHRRVVSNVEPGYLRKLLPDGPPVEGEQWADIQKDVEAKIMPGLTHWYVHEPCIGRLYQDQAEQGKGNTLTSWHSSLPM